MDDLGNIIYILIGIGWFFWNAYKKSQSGKERAKPVRKQTAPASPNKADSGYKTLEDLIFGKTKEPQFQSEQHSTVESNYKNQDKFLSIDRDHSHLPDDYQMSVGESGSHRVQRQIVPLFKEEKEEELSLKDELFPEGFDLKKAVVLNAILERPYK